MSIGTTERDIIIAVLLDLCEGEGCIVAAKLADKAVEHGYPGEYGLDIYEAL